MGLPTVADIQSSLADNPELSPEARAALRARVRGGRSLGWMRGLSVRLAILLSGAMVPLGLIAVDQTVRLQQEVIESNNLSLQAVTAEFAQEERELISNAFSAAEVLSLQMPQMLSDPATCNALLSTFISKVGERYSFAGFMPRSGVMECTSAGLVIDYTTNPNFSEWMENPRRRIRMNNVGPIIGGPVLVVSEPVFDARGVFLGLLNLNIPHVFVDARFQEKLGERPLDIVIISAAGDVLSASGAQTTARDMLPAGRSIRDLAREGANQIETQNAAGQNRVFSILPLYDGSFYVVGSWDPTATETVQDETTLQSLLLTPALFPILMWLISLVLLYFAMDRQVVRYLRLIGVQMRRFASDRRLPDAPSGLSMPYELEIIEEQFMQVAAKLMRDEADLMDAMHDKDVLLKELHHRVKNNLQLISSIISMQMRRTRNPVTAAALDTVNRRVSSMATVHQTLYQASELGRVPADELLRAVVRPLTDLAPVGPPRTDISVDLDNVILYPDQAVPATLLTVEAVTNALKYIGTNSAGKRWVRISLERLEGDGVRITVANSISKIPTEVDEDGTGLGSQLINGFARQLETIPDMKITNDIYSISVTFDTVPFDTEDTSAPSGLAPSHHI